MLEQMMIREQFQTLLSESRQAAQDYAKLAGRLDNGALRSQVEQLQKDKQRHVRLAQRLLEIIQ